MFVYAPRLSYIKSFNFRGFDFMIWFWNLCSFAGRIFIVEMLLNQVKIIIVDTSLDHFGPR